MSASFSLGSAFLDLTSSDARLFASLTRVEATMLRVQTRMRSFSATARVLFLAAGSALAGAVAAAARLESQMAKVGTVLGKNSATDLPEFTAQIQALSQQFGESTAKLSQGLYDILSAGIAPAQAMTVLAAAAQSAKAGFSDTSVAVDGLTSILNAYGLQANTVKSVNDSLFQAVRIGKLEFDDLSLSIGKVAPFAKLAGVNLNTLLAAMSTLTNAGLSTSEASVQLTNLFKAFAKPSTSATAFAKQIGFELDGAAVTGDRLLTTLSKLQGLNVDQLLKIFPDIRGARGVALLASHIQNLRDAMKQMEGSAGATAIAFEQVEGTLNFRFDQVVQGIIATAREIGNLLLPYVTQAFIYIRSNLIPALQNWIAVNSDLVVRIAATSTAILGTGAAVLTLLKVFRPLSEAVLFFASTPLVATITGLAALAGYLVYSTAAGDTFGEKMQSIGKEITDIWEPARPKWQAFTGFVNSAFETLRAAMSSFVTGGAIAILYVEKYAQRAYDVTKYFWGSLIPDIFRYATEYIGNAIYNMAAYSITVLENFGSNVTGFFSAMWKYITENIQSGGKTAFQYAWTPLTQGFQAAVAQLPQIASFQTSQAEKNIDAGISSLRDRMNSEQNQTLKDRERADNDANAKALERARKAGEAQGKALTPPDIKPPKLPDIQGGPDQLKTDVKAQIVGLQDAFKRIQESAAGGSPTLQVARAQLTEQQKTANAADSTKTNTQKMLDQLQQLNSKLPLPATAV